MTVFRLAHLSDIHFGDQNRDALAATSEWLAEHAVDLVVVSGDLTRYAEVAEFEAAAAWLDTLPQPRLVTPGNHDAPYLAPVERILTPFRRFERLIGPAASQTWRDASTAVRGVNTARGAQPRLNWSKGWITAKQADEAVAWFQPDDALRIVVVHHPLIEMLGGPMSARVWGGGAAAERFAKGHVDLVLSGHIHAPFVWPYPAGDHKTYAVGAGTLSIRERGVAAGFNMIEVDAGQIQVTALSWSGSKLAPSQTWAVDKR